MATLEVKPAVHEGHPTVFVDTFTNGVLGPGQEMLGPVMDGGHIVVNTAPGCWGPMITPRLRGGHEVARPVAVAGAMPGDAIAIRIKDIVVTSMATASGNDRWIEGRFNGDPYCARVCAGCGTPYPETRLDGIGQDAVRCANCSEDATPFKFTNGYTIAFDEARRLGVTLQQAAAEEIAGDAAHFAALPENSVQHPILAFAPHDLVGVVARLRPFMGQIGTSPSIDMPDSHNAGDFGSFLIGAPHDFALTPEELVRHKTDGHMDVETVRAGAILVCPVKLPGGGVYLGDMHALQGDGEIAGHTCDVSGTVTLQVEVVKGLDIDGPVLLPLAEDLPFLAKPLSDQERIRARALAARWGLAEIEESAPITVIGSGPDLNAATDNGLERAAELCDMTVPEVKNRATITGAIQIGRHPGVVRVTFRAPLAALERRGLARFATEMYGENP
ncbi:MAG: acetamidase/formamidase family protein [Gemmatimonadales bacterium]